MPWLQTFQPDIDWKKGRVRGRPKIIKTTNDKPPKWAQISRITLQAKQITRKIDMEKGDEIHVAIEKTMVAQEWAEKMHKLKQKDPNNEVKIPMHYTEFSDVFSEEAAQQFPPA